MHKLSVIIPVYNTRDFLRECIDSVINEPSVEVIVVDDGSTDGSAFIALQYDTIKYIHTDHVGVSQARNAGLDAATGEYVAFLDSDDAYLPGALSLMRQCLGNDNQIDIVAGQMTHYKADMMLTRFSPVTLTGDEALEKILYQRSGFHPSVCAKIFRRSLFDNCRFTPGHRYEDLEITPRLYHQACKVATFPSSIYFYRKNSSSFINNWTPDRADALWATDSIAQFIANHCPAITKAAQSRRFSAYYNIYLLAKKNNEPTLAKHCLEYLKANKASILKNPRTRLKNKLGALYLLIQ